MEGERMDWLKRCGGCGELKGVRFFSRCKGSKDGLQHQCKACDKAYREANRERIGLLLRAWREKRGREYGRAYREANRERIKAYERAYKRRNKDLINERARARRREKAGEGR